MPKFIFLMFLSCLTGISAASPNDDSNSNYILYEIDLTKTDDDLFHISVYPGELSSENQYFNFVAFAPGVHQVLDYGRFVKSLTAYDKNDSVIITEKISLNKWLISTPEKVYKIDYVVEDSFDAELEEHKIYPMSGTGIEKDFIILNKYFWCSWIFQWAIK